MKAPNLRRLSLVVLDAAVFISSFAGAFLLRFDLTLEPPFLGIMLETAPYALVIYAACAHAFGLYRGLYRFSSFPDLLNIVRATAASAVMSAVVILFARHGGLFPRSVLILHPVLAFLGICALRFGIRLLKGVFDVPRAPRGDERKVLLVGAGELGEQVARQMLGGHSPGYHVVGFIDDDESKWDLSLHGVTVLGGRRALGSILAKNPVDEVVITLESRRGEVVRSIVDEIRASGLRVEVKIAPGLEEMLRGAGLSLRRVKPADLLNRKEIHLDLDRLAALLRGKKVMITGAGGTIGSELARQVAAFGPSRLILMDSHSTSLFYREAEIKDKAPTAAVLGDIRDQALIDQVVGAHRPDIILHAAAHKHVPQLESNPHEGISNNLLGTYALAQAAHRHRVRSFLLISTDKAVRPSSLMGATKRAAELVMLHFSRKSQTQYAAVRFGNVLGSSGSVLEIFREQIARGGPLTVTHADATRYFMTVEEAVQLVLQALTMARGNEIYVLNMGTPVKIMDMALNLVQLSGLIPGKDIEIKFTGLRPGEKLHEELMEDPAGFDPSTHPDIMILRKENAVPEDLEPRIAELELLCRTGSAEALTAKLRELVPSYQAEPSCR